MFLILFIVSALSTLRTSASCNCTQNEVSSDCASPCPPICADQREIRCNFLVCNKGCVCKQGYIRREEGAPCIPIDKCPAYCPDKNEVQVECVTHYPSTCQRPYPRRLASSACEGACVCKKGYIRNYKNGPCIPQSQCKASCRKNEIYKEGASVCPKMCYGNTGVCIKIGVSACVCKKDYVLDNESEECIRPSECQHS